MLFQKRAASISVTRILNIPTQEDSYFQIRMHEKSRARSRKLSEEQKQEKCYDAGFGPKNGGPQRRTVIQVGILGPSDIFVSFLDVSSVSQRISGQ